jgi:signal transduction histidine kinase
VGFDAASPRKSGSLGLAGVRERAQLLNGRVAVHSRPGEGTTVDAFLPMPQERAT